MDSPVRKMLKRNDYNRHKLLRKIRRLRRAQIEQLKVAAEKELKRRLRVTPPKFGDGKEPTLLDADKVRMNEQGLFLDEAGNIVGDSVILPELTVRPTTPQTNSSSYYQQWLMRQADRGGRNMSSSDREVYDRMMNRIANQNEVKNFTGFDGTIYNHGSGALEQVSPEFDILTLGRQFYTDGLFDIIGNVGKNALKKAHIGNYYIKPHYNDYSYIRQIGDDAVEDMIRTNQMRSTLAVEREQRPWDELGALLGNEPKELSRMIPDGKGSMTIPFKYRLNTHKLFEDQMYYTGRPFYGDIRTNYIVTKPRTLTGRKDLTNKGLEWIESNHKNHTGVAKKLAEAKGIDPNTAPGRIVVPLWNGEKNVIPVDALGEFDLYRPVKVGNINMPFYRKYSYGAKQNNVTSLKDWTPKQWTPEQWTAAQDAAIARGDMVEAQRLRDLHFKVSAPNTKIVDKNGNPLHTYHGGQKGITAFLNPNEFDTSIKLNNYYKDGRNRIGIYTSDWESYAKQYARGYKKKDRDIYDLYVNMENPRYIGYLETKLNQLRNLNPFRKKDYLNPSIIRPEHKEQLLSGYDGVKWDIENAVFNGKQLKSADAVTYDDKGVRIPLGLRDNFKSKDIRYGIIPLIGGAALSVNRQEER